WTMLLACGDPLVCAAEVSRTVEEIVARFPEDAFMIHHISQAYSARGCEKEALEYAWRALARSPTSLEVQLGLAHVYARFHRWEAMAALYEELAQTCGRSCDYLCA